MHQPSNPLHDHLVNEVESIPNSQSFNQLHYLFYNNKMGQLWENRQVSAVYNSLSPFLTDSNFLTSSFVFDDQSMVHFEAQKPEYGIAPNEHPDKQEKTMALQEEYSNFSLEKNNLEEENSALYVPDDNQINEENRQEEVVEFNSNNSDLEQEVFKLSKKKKNKKSKKKSVEVSVSSFAQWLLNQNQFGKKPRAAKEISGKEKVKRSAQKSILPSEDIVSESLAKILQTQGHYLKAKNMYKKLIQKFPEKSEQYQNVIEELNVLIENKD